MSPFRHHLERGNYEQVSRFVEAAIHVAEKFQSLDATTVLADAHFCLGATKAWQRDIPSSQYHSERCLSLRLAAAPNGVSYPLAIAYDEVGHCYLLRKSYDIALDFELKSIAIFEALEQGQGDAKSLKLGNYAGSFARYCASIALIKLDRLEEAEAMIMSLWTRQERVWDMVNKEVFKYALAVLSPLRRQYRPSG
jgi:tetratricopeptide (TPR) repeat protein